MRRLVAVLSAVWEAEWGLSAMLVFLVLSLFVAGPLVATETVGRYLFDLFFSLLLVSGVITVSRQRLLPLVIATMTLVTLLVRWTSYGSKGVTMAVWDDALSILSIGILTVLVLGQVFRRGPITGYRIQGAIVVYLLLGLIWTQAYELVYRVLPGAFRFPDGEPEHYLTHGLGYYSFVTLTTVGYGDIIPTHPITRSLAVAEALIGQLYPAILIARLVSLELMSSRRHD